MKPEQKILAGVLNRRRVDDVPHDADHEYAKEHNLICMYIECGDGEETIGVFGEFLGDFEMVYTPSTFFFNGELLYHNFGIPKGYGIDIDIPFKLFMATEDFRHVIHEVYANIEGDINIFETGVPHEVFNLVCDGEICSIGIIIDKNDLMEE